MPSTVAASPHAARCVEACQACISACDQALAAFATEGPPGPLEHVADLCRSCIRICGLAIDELKLASGFSTQICALAAVICRACANDCELHRAGSWPAVAEACRRAARECHALAAPASKRRG